MTRETISHFPVNMTLKHSIFSLRFNVNDSESIKESFFINHSDFCFTFLWLIIYDKVKRKVHFGRENYLKIQES